MIGSDEMETIEVFFVIATLVGSIFLIVDALLDRIGV